ncbi:type I-F CRISPR-associated protein Csy2 [Nitrosococcus oceani]|uniref:type I-F CRISPR-associated protein Csy2 n=1 Tax=Nitrosococcus oceani TaxID=1229 RepID=UPI0004E95D48|nr:type I-F CRISPR-associated protein Csy2 [Nitrosococcus oceani]KFI21589.1 CRISPR-associated protein [Nitrosococcus oceani]
MSAILILRHLKVENANAIAGHTWGFPAISNFLGFVHALSRKTKPELGLTLNGCGVICHRSQVQAYQPGGWGDWVFALSRNPLTKESKTAAFVEEGRMHLDISLVIPVEGRIVSGEDHAAELQNKLAHIVQTLRLAGGTIRDLARVELHSIPYDEEDQIKLTRKLMRSLLPGFALVSRAETLADHLDDLQRQNPQAEPLDAWLDFAALKYQATAPNESKADNTPVEWKSVPKPANGWLVPITIGYRAISELYEPGTVARTRDIRTPFRFVEAVYSLGQWLSPHRITRWEDLLWHYQADPDSGWYLCANQWQPEEEFEDCF